MCVTIANFITLLIDLSHCLALSSRIQARQKARSRAKPINGGYRSTLLRFVVALARVVAVVAVVVIIVVVVGAAYPQESNQRNSN